MTSAQERGSMSSPALLSSSSSAFSSFSSSSSSSSSLLAAAASSAPTSVKAPHTPTRCSQNSVPKSPWWQCLSPLDPSLSYVKSPVMPSFQRPIRVEESPSSQSPLYNRTRISPNTVRRALGWRIGLPTESLVVQAMYEEAKTQRGRRKFMQKLDFSNKRNKRAKTSEEPFKFFDSSPAEQDSMPPQNPLNWSPSRERPKTVWCSIATDPSITSDSSSHRIPRMPHVSIPESPSTYELTPSSPPFDPSAPPASSSTDVDPSGPSPTPASSGGNPALASASPAPTPSRSSGRRHAGGRPRAPDTTSGSSPQGENAKPCNCKKSKCLKLYCECFARQGYCVGCNCVGCHNIPEHEESREKAIIVTLERDPNAFFRAGKTGLVDKTASKHRRGCHCKKSECLKKYCECFQAGVSCSDICKCLDCRNGKESCSPAAVKKVKKKKEILRTVSNRSRSVRLITS